MHTPVTYAELGELYARSTGDPVKDMPVRDLVWWAFEQPEITIRDDDQMVWRKLPPWEGEG